MTTSTTTELTQKEFSRRVKAFISAKYIRQYNASPTRLTQVLSHIQRFARYNEEDGISYLYENVCYSIGWALETGRVSGVVHMAIKALSVADLIALIWDVAREAPLTCNVPAYLISRYTTKEI